MNQESISIAIQNALEQQQYGSADLRREIAFHMTDWLEELEGWTAFCSSPDGFDSDAITKLLTGFLVHVPNHVAAASKLMTGIPVSDIFDVGAVESDSD